jgi:hypothetical protein
MRPSGISSSTTHLNPHSKKQKITLPVCRSKQAAQRKGQDQSQQQ